MQKEKKLSLFPRFSDRLILISTSLLALYGSFMIISAEMGESTADLGVIFSGAKKQFLFLFLAIILMFLTMKYLARFVNKLSMKAVWILYFFMLGLLILPRAFPSSGGAYAWIYVAGFSLQPSEFAKLFVIFFASKMFAKNEANKNVNNLIKYGISVFVYFLIVAGLEKDFGSAAVIFIIAYACALIPPYPTLRKMQNIMIVIILCGFALLIFLLSPIGTELLSKYDDSYQIMRFLASANPFNYQYDSGYHLIMSLVSIATGGFFGLGYSQSIHKFMNFPNPSTDFILPVIIEEMGLIGGFIPVITLYGFIVVPLAIHGYRCQFARGKIVMIGTFMYFISHFIFNVGGIAGLIPLTGIPLLLVSSGGSSLLSCMICIGFAESEIIHYRQKAMEEKCE